MVARLRRFFDVRPGEGLRVLLSFLYVAVVVAAFLLAKPIRNSLFLRAIRRLSAGLRVCGGAGRPVAVRAGLRAGRGAVRLPRRHRRTLVFFSSHVVLFWYAFRFHADAIAVHGSVAWLLPAAFYVWVNCFGVIAPVQAWSFANSLFDTRQARRLFGLIAGGASLGAMAAGLLARFLVEPVGGTVNMMLVLSALILAAAVVVTIANMRLRVRGEFRRGRRRSTRSATACGRLPRARTSG